MTVVSTLVRALRHRAGTTLVILVVALCATAAATVGPTYYIAARQSILQDTFTSAGITGRGIQFAQPGQVSGSLDSFRRGVSAELTASLHGPRLASRVLAPPVESLETTSFFAALGENVPLVWRTGVCAHLVLRAGRCPTRPGEVLASAALASGNHWRTGDVVHAAGRPPLTITGVYDLPHAVDDYWFGRGSIYFPTLYPSLNATAYDALFTPRQTIERLAGNPQGTAVIDWPLAVAHIRPGDVDVLRDSADTLPIRPLLVHTSVLTAIPSAVADVHASWSALAVPVVVVTAELLALTWLLLFLVVTDAVEARGSEIALAKLRGYSAVRALVFGLSEPVALLVLALPVGALVGWVATISLSRALLRSGTPVGLPGVGWLGAAVATIGGLAAVVVAARRTVRRPVVEEWRRTGRRATDRGWLFDAVVLTGAVAGLIQLGVSGTLGSTSHNALALLVPGLVGVAVAVVGSRLLPVACRAAFRRTRQRGSLGTFLAMRHVARRPGGTRTTMMLATAVALATFSVASWSVSSTNRARVADVTVGAPAVFYVTPPFDGDLGKEVARIDPSGHDAAAVQTLAATSTTTLAVQPARFALVAQWHAAFVQHPENGLRRLAPPAPAPVVVAGDSVRLRLVVARLRPLGSELVLNVVARGSSAPTPVELGPVNRTGAMTTRAGGLACPCTLHDLQISPPGGRPAQVTGRLTLTGVDVHDGTGWHAVPGIDTQGHWADLVDQEVELSESGDGVHWSFFAPLGTPPTLSLVDRPDPLPAVLSAKLGDTTQVSGLDGGPLTVTPVAQVPAVPGAPDVGAVVDLDYATRAAAGYVGASISQVWTTGSAAERIRHRLEADGYQVYFTASSTSTRDRLDRAGPGLASVLFLADAAAAAVLAALAAVLGLSAAARRRRYEYAALAATGASSRTLYTAVAVEQLTVLGFGLAIGVAAGALAIALAVRSVPAFVVTPSSDLLTYRPSLAVLAAAIGAAAVIVFSAAAMASAALLRSVNPDQLREGAT